MKATIFVVAFALCALAAAAQDSTSKHMMHVSPDKYCVSMKDGKSVVMAGGKTVTWTVKLSDGSKLSPDGVMTKKDGSRVVLKNGECVDNSGMMKGSDKMNKGGM